ncbi:hypothetical protein JYK13_02960 [Citrobacter sp. ku-bf4]|uniref:hypothetical protein n=1 Tax=Citrobacter TaxID=544 RepID=UPI0019810179|nr:MULTISPECIES: hypothetical protein [Citrobacter]MBN6042932.1 hypothetical protein [Citrobacter sp. ku-bf4]MBS0824308.1 hypothetical protein [Citrobacter amalonaticus]
MREFNKYESFYVTAMEILENLIIETINKENELKTPHDENYLAGYLTALKKVQMSFERQANLFNIHM